MIQAARESRRLAVSALAVHGLMTGVLDPQHKYRLNHLDLLVPDGQPVRWALNLLHKTELKDRVYGPNLMLAVCSRAQDEAIPIFLYGSTDDTLTHLTSNLLRRFPTLQIAGTEASKFRRLSGEEKARLVDRIRKSGAGIVFVGLGCPRQEVWAYEFANDLALPVLAVGAAFPFHGGRLRQAPPWMQSAGLEWLFRLWLEPRRLWARYLLLNPAYLTLLGLQFIGLRHFSADGIPAEKLFYG